MQANACVLQCVETSAGSGEARLPAALRFPAQFRQPSAARRPEKALIDTSSPEELAQELDLIVRFGLFPHRKKMSRDGKSSSPSPVTILAQARNDRALPLPFALSEESCEREWEGLRACPVAASPQRPAKSDGCGGDEMVDRRGSVGPAQWWNCSSSVEPTSASVLASPAEMTVLTRSK